MMCYEIRNEKKFMIKYVSTRFHELITHALLCEFKIGIFFGILFYKYTHIFFIFFGHNVLFYVWSMAYIQEQVMKNPVPRATFLWHFVSSSLPERAHSRAGTPQNSTKTRSAYQATHKEQSHSRIDPMDLDQVACGAT